MTLPRPLPLRTQLRTGSPTAGDDCAALAIINAMRWASRGHVGPRSQGAVADWVRRVRVWGHAPLSTHVLPPGRDNAGMLFRTEVLRAYRNPQLIGLVVVSGHALVSTYHYRRPWKDVIRLLEDGHLVHLPVDYGVLRRGYAPMGSDTFSGGHSVVLAGYDRNKLDQVLTHDGDSLMDGRRAGIPKGWQRTHASYFQDAAEAWSGGGGVTFIDIRRR